MIVWYLNKRKCCTRYDNYVCQQKQLNLTSYNSYNRRFTPMVGRLLNNLNSNIFFHTLVDFLCLLNFPNKKPTIQLSAMIQLTNVTVESYLNTRKPPTIPQNHALLCISPGGSLLRKGRQWQGFASVFTAFSFSLSLRSRLPVADDKAANFPNA